MNRLVGIPWGDNAPPQQADCVSLAVYAQKLLWGREIDLKGINTNWQELSLREMSFEIEKVVPTLFDEIDYPIVGGIGTIETVGFKHIVTFVAIDLILHTCINSKSRMSKFRESTRMTYWKIKQ